MRERESSTKHFVVSAPDAQATMREIEAELRECGMDPRQEPEDVLRYYQSGKSAVGEVYVSERAARLLEERGRRPGVLRYSVPAQDVPAEARGLASLPDKPDVPAR